MKRIICILIIFFGSYASFSQDYRYSFKIVDATTNQQGKETIAQLRDLMGVTIVHFYESSELFVVETHHDFIEEELIYKLALNDVLINGDVLKEILE